MALSKTWWSVIVGAASTAAAILTKQKSKPAPPPVVRPPDPPARFGVRVEVFDGPVEVDDKIPHAAVTLGTVTTWTDGAGNAQLLALPGLYTMTVTASGYVDASVPVTVPVEGPVRVSLTLERVELPPLATSGKVFTANGQAWRWKGVSAFQLLDRYVRGEDLGPFLRAYAGYNVLRVWPYVPAKDWGDKAWGSPPANVIRDFVEAMARQGFYVELTLLTDDDPEKLAWAKALVPQLAGLRTLLIEGGNEPRTHKAIDTAALRGVLDASGCLHASGDYEESQRAYGSYLVAHTGRDSQWVRRAHDLLEYYEGGGPNDPSDPAHHVPIVADEPIRPDQAGYNAADFRAYAGACALLGAGMTFHTETGKYGLPPTPEEARIAAVVLDALNAFPADAPNGSYRRIDESGRSLRTYVIGERYMVRVRPTTKDAPEAGWTALDGDGILWRKQ